MSGFNLTEGGDAPGGKSPVLLSLKSPAIKDRIPKKVSLIRQDHSEIGFVL